MNRLKKIGKWFARTVIVGIITLFVLEIVYRYQWVDFYKSEWAFHNDEVQNNDDRLLVFGDSFSADPEGWVYMLRDSLTDIGVYNASIPGIGPETFELIASRSIEKARPNHVIIQLYVGNDLYDMHKPVNWSAHSFTRNLFWSISNDFRILNFINYRVGQSSVEDYLNANPKAAEQFDKTLYSPRTKLYINGDQSYPSSMIRLKDKEGFNEVIEGLKYIEEQLPEACELSVLVIPHCTQVSEDYVRRYRSLGAKISNDLVGDNSWVYRLKKEGFQVINPLSSLSQHEDSGNTVYYTNDPHLNELGNQTLTSLVIKTLEK